MIPAENPAILSVSITNGMRVEIRLGMKEIRIGRGREADLLLSDPSVSRLHARIFRVGNQYFLSDNSKNGTFVGERRISQTRLEDGLTFRIGPFQIHFSRDERLHSPADPPTVVPGAVADPSNHTDRRTPSRIPTGAFGMIGQSVMMKDLVKNISRVAASDFPVLIEGETGSGKELVSRGIHECSGRKDGPFVVVNCGAISSELIESELFGYEKGAFTGASAAGKNGLVEQASGGTLFLDEVGDLSPEAQAKLLRFLEEGTFYRVGGTKPRRVPARVVSATNKDLPALIGEGRFREDLFYRLAVVRVKVPSLNERPEDILPIARHFLVEYGRKFGKSFTGIDRKAEEFLRRWRWRGNVRELKNMVERGALVGKGPVLLLADLGVPERRVDGFGASPATGHAHLPLSPEGIDFDHLQAEFERHYVREALRLTGGNESRAALLLRMNHHTFRYRKKKLGL